MFTIEDCLEALMGLKVGPTCQIEKSDYNLLSSLARQVHRGIGLTDRQYELAKEKVLYYKDQLTALEYNVDVGVGTLRIPLREIDRSRWIKIVDQDNTYKIAVRFSFQKKLLTAIEEINKRVASRADYDKVEKVHYFPYSERNLWEIVQAFEGKHFELDETVKSIIEKLSLLSPEDHVPGVYNYELLNLPNRAVNFITDEIGHPNHESLLLFKDRRFKYGLNYFNDDYVKRSETNFSPLARSIANRNHINVVVRSTSYNIGELILALEELKRFPILIALPEKNCLDALVNVHGHVRNLINNTDTSVMFRMDNVGEGVHFNSYIKEHNLNNKLAISTKIVYTTDNKIPKPVFESNWKPSTVIYLGGEYMQYRKTISHFVENDLVLVYADDVSPTLRHSHTRNSLEII